MKYRLSWQPAAVAFGIVALSWLLPTAFGKSLFSSGWIDRAPSHWGSSPSVSWFHASLREGSLPLWNPMNGLGEPSFSSFFLCLFSPFHWLALAAPEVWSWEVIIALRLGVYAVGALWLLRTWGTRPSVAVLFACLAALTGHAASSGNAWHFNTLAIAPFFLVGLTRSLDRQQTRLPRVLLVITVPLLVFGSGFIDLILLGTLSSLFVVAAVWLSIKSGEGVPVRRLGRLALDISLGIGLSAVYLIPVLELRHHGVAALPTRGVTVYPKAIHSLALFLSSWAPDPPPYFLKFLPQRLSLLILPLVATGGILAIRRGYPARRWFVVCCAFASCYWAKAFGLEAVQWLGRVLPWQYVRFEKYFGLPELCLFLAAALGLEWWLRSTSIVSRWVLAATGIGTGLLSLVFYLSLDPRPQLDPQTVFGYAGLPILLAGAAFWTGRASGASPAKRSALPVIVLLVTSYWVDFDRDFWRERGNFRPASEAMADIGPTGPDGPARLWVARPGWQPNSLSAFGVQDLGVYSDSLQVDLRTFLRDHAIGGRVINFLTVIGSAEYGALDYDLLEFLGVTHYWVRPRIEPIQGHSRLGTLGLLRVEDAVPRASLASSVEFSSDRSAVLAQIVANPNRHRHHAVITGGAPGPIECSAGTPTSIGHASNIPQSVSHEARIEEYEPDRIRIEVRAEAPSLLVLRDRFYPGWLAFVDGRETIIREVDLLFRGVCVPAGSSEVLFVYRPRSLFAGAWLTLAVFLGLMISMCYKAPIRSRGSSEKEQALRPDGL